MKRLKIGVLASGGGSNLQSIIDRSLDGSLEADVIVVISNNSCSGALERARNLSIDALHISGKTEESQEAADKRITDELAARNVDVIALAGYMKKIGSSLLDSFGGRIINIHPALLPKFGGVGMYGMHVHEAVIAAGEKESGATVHMVDGEYDRGKIIAQAKVPVMPDDKPDTLQKRVLLQEHILYPAAIQKLVEQWGK